MNNLLKSVIIVFGLIAIADLNLNAQQYITKKTFKDERIKKNIFSFNFDTIMVPNDDGILIDTFLVNYELVSTEHYESLERPKRKVLKKFGGIYTNGEDILLIVGENKVFFYNKWYDTLYFFTTFLRFREGQISLLDGSGDNIFLYLNWRKNFIYVFLENETKNIQRDEVIELE